MESTSTITIASLASVIALGLLKMMMNARGFKFSCSNGAFNISGRVGEASPRVVEPHHSHPRDTDVP